MKWKSLSCVRLLRCYGLNSPCSFPGQNTGVGSLTLLGIFPTQRSNPGLPHYMWIFYQLSHKRSPSNKRVVVVKSLSHVRLFATPWTVACQAPLSMGFSRQEYWSGLPFPSPGDLRDPGIEPRSPALQADTLTSEPPGKPQTEIPNKSGHLLLFPVSENGNTVYPIFWARSLWIQPDLSLLYTHLHWREILLILPPKNSCKTDFSLWLSLISDHYHCGVKYLPDCIL